MLVSLSIALLVGWRVLRGGRWLLQRHGNTRGNDLRQYWDCEILFLSYGL